jgi:hypothetical protein
MAIAVSILLEASGAGSRFSSQRLRMAAATLMAIALPLLLGACNDAHPLYGPDTPRNGAGMPVDPVYGTQLPGTAKVSD